MAALSLGSWTEYSWSEESGCVHDYFDIFHSFESRKMNIAQNLFLCTVSTPARVPPLGFANPSNLPTILGSPTKKIGLVAGSPASPGSHQNSPSQVSTPALVSSVYYITCTEILVL